MRKLNRILLSSALAIAAATALAQSNAQPAGPNLGIGDNAPKLSVAKWVKGSPVHSINKGKIYVVEFWATWCGPCKISIPHLTELQKKFGDKATFIGVSSFENDWTKVEPFVKSEGDQMDYNVAMDKIDNPTDREGFMAKHWMDAAHQPGIPTAFIVNKEGKIAWIGHPMGLEAPLTEVVAGTWDRDAAAKKFAEAAEQQKKQAEAMVPVNKLMKQYSADMKDKHYKEALADLDGIVAINSAFAPRVDMMRLQVYSTSNDTDGYATLANKLMDGQDKDNAMTLNQIAWYIVDPKGTLTPRDTKIAMKAAAHAVEVSERKEAAMIDTLAWCYYWQGDKAKAIELETEAMSKLGPQDQKSDYDMSMETFKK